MLSDDGEDSMEWRNASTWVQKQIQMGTDPRDVLRLLFSDPTQVPEEVDDVTLWRVCIFFYFHSFNLSISSLCNMNIHFPFSTDCYEYDVRTA